MLTLAAKQYTQGCAGTEIQPWTLRRRGLLHERPLGSRREIYFLFFCSYFNTNNVFVVKRESDYAEDLQEN